MIKTASLTSLSASADHRSGPHLGVIWQIRHLQQTPTVTSRDVTDEW